MSRLAQIFKHRPNFRRNIPALGLLALYLYLAFHAFSGSQGLVRWMDYSDQTERLEKRLVAVQTQREGLEAEVESLRADALDLDVLDVRAREMLFVSDPKDITIWLDQNP